MWLGTRTVECQQGLHCIPDEISTDSAWRKCVQISRWLCTTLGIESPLGPAAASTPMFTFLSDRDFHFVIKTVSFIAAVLLCIGCVAANCELLESCRTADCSLSHLVYSRVSCGSIVRRLPTRGFRMTQRCCPSVCLSSVRLSDPFGPIGPERKVAGKYSPLACVRHTPNFGREGQRSRSFDPVDMSNRRRYGGGSYWKQYLRRTWCHYRRLATALAHAYNVIEMCAPAAPPIRLPIPNPNPKP